MGVVVQANFQLSSLQKESLLQRNMRKMYQYDSKRISKIYNEVLFDITSSCNPLNGFESIHGNVELTCILYWNHSSQVIVSNVIKVSWNIKQGKEAPRKVGGELDSENCLIGIAKLSQLTSRVSLSRSWANAESLQFIFWTFLLHKHKVRPKKHPTYVPSGRNS